VAIEWMYDLDFKQSSSLWTQKALLILLTL